MGDRGNVVVTHQGAPKLYLYTHWSGSDLPQIVASALDRGAGRWGDDPYLNRIIFCEMVQGNEMEVTGFGIDWQEGDGGTEVYIDHGEQTATYEGTEYTFSEFIEAFAPIRT